MYERKLYNYIVYTCLGSSRRYFRLYKDKTSYDTGFLAEPSKNVSCSGNAYSISWIPLAWACMIPHDLNAGKEAETSVVKGDRWQIGLFCAHVRRTCQQHSPNPSRCYPPRKRSVASAWCHLQFLPSCTLKRRSKIREEVGGPVACHSCLEVSATITRYTDSDYIQ